MNSNHSTLCFRYEENKMECNIGRNNHRGREIQTVNVNITRIFDNHTDSALLFKNICLHKKIQQQDGFQPPSHKTNAIIYIK